MEPALIRINLKKHPAWMQVKQGMVIMVQGVCFRIAQIERLDRQWLELRCVFAKRNDPQPDYRFTIGIAPQLKRANS